MTDPELPDGGQSTAAVPGVLPAGTVTAEPPVVRRGRRRWPVVAAVALVVVLGAGAGLVLWAPWRSPPLLRPAGLAAGTSTTSSVAFHWSGPATGPPPDKYVIMNGATVIGTVSGTVTSFRSIGLNPATRYEYRVVAERGGKRSAPSSLLAVRTSAPPLTAARWQGPWTVRVKIVRGGAALRGPRPLRWTEPWQVNPQCFAGPCAVRVSGTFNGRSFKATLTRAGDVYKGKTTANSFRCGPRSGALPVHTALKIRVALTAARGDSGAWAASAWSGTVGASAAYTSSGTFYCNAFHVTATVSGHS